jgi:hypothetical protein
MEASLFSESDAHTMRRWVENNYRYTCCGNSLAMPPSITRKNRNNPDFEDFLHGTYGVEVVLEREVGASFE